MVQQIPTKGAPLRDSPRDSPEGSPSPLIESPLLYAPHRAQRPPTVLWCRYRSPRLRARTLSQTQAAVGVEPPHSGSLVLAETGRKWRGCRGWLGRRPGGPGSGLRACRLCRHARLSLLWGGRVEDRPGCGSGRGCGWGRRCGQPPGPVVLPSPSSGPVAREGPPRRRGIAHPLPEARGDPGGESRAARMQQAGPPSGRGRSSPPSGASGSSPLWVDRAGPPGGRGRGDGRGGRSVQAGPARACHPSAGRARSPVVRRACAAVGRRARWRARGPRVLGWLLQRAQSPPLPTPWRAGPTGAPRRRRVGQHRGRNRRPH